MQTPISLEDLPRECLVAVLQYTATKDWIRLACTSSYFRELIKDDSLWKSLAIRKWGPSVETLAASRIQPGQWQHFCRHRMSFVAMPDISPLNLIQEQFTDPWSHIACCLLCSRTTGGPTVRTAIFNVLTRWPSPSAILEASEEDLAEAINPLGLQLNRINAIKCMSRDFLAQDWEQVIEFKGCGKFTNDSWRIFCRGHRAMHDVDDVNLRRYLQYVMKESGEDATGDEKPKKKPVKNVSSLKTAKKNSSSSVRGKKQKTKQSQVAANRGIRGPGRHTRSSAGDEELVSL